MVLFVDLEDDDEEYSNLTRDNAIHTAQLQKLKLEESGSDSLAASTHGDRHQDEHVSYNGFSAALSCYP